jgi:hypothetical protein
MKQGLEGKETLGFRVKWLVEHGCPLPFWDVRYFATKFGHLDVLEWLDGVEANV